MYVVVCFFFFKQKTAYEMRISDWSSDVCSSDLQVFDLREPHLAGYGADDPLAFGHPQDAGHGAVGCLRQRQQKAFADRRALGGQVDHAGHHHDAAVAHEGHPALLHEAGALGREKAAEQESLHIGAPERRGDLGTGKAVAEAVLCAVRSEEHTSELQSLMRISYAV